MNVRYGAGEVIFREGDPGQYMYEIVGGEAEVYLSYGTAEEKKIAVLQAGSLFGEMSLLEDYPRSATVTAGAAGAELLGISREELNACFQEDPARLFRIMRNLSYRLRALTGEYHEACRTISDIRQSMGVKENRTPDLLTRIERFIRFAGRNPYREALSSDSLEKEQQIAELSSQIPVKNGGIELEGMEGQIIFREGEMGLCMYYILSGKVGIYSAYGASDEKRLAVLRENQFFGEMGMVEKVPRSATAVVLENHSRMERIGEKELEIYCRTNPEMVLRALRSLSSRLRSLTEDYLEACERIKQMEMLNRENKDAGDWYTEYPEPDENWNPMHPESEYWY